MAENWKFVERQECPYTWIGYEDFLSADGTTVKRVWDDGEIEYYKTA